MSGQDLYQKKAMDAFAKMSTKQQEQAMRDLFVQSNGGVTREQYDALAVENVILRAELAKAKKHDNFGL